MSIFDPDLGPRTPAEPVQAAPPAGDLTFPACLACKGHPCTIRRQDGSVLVEHVCATVNRSSWVNGDSEAHAREVWAVERFKFWRKV